MTTMTLSKTRTALPQTRSEPARTVAPRLERRWFKIEGRLECRWVEA